MTQDEYEDRRGVLEARYRLTFQSLVRQGRSEDDAEDEAWLGYKRRLDELKAERDAP